MIAERRLTREEFQNRFTKEVLIGNDLALKSNNLVFLKKELEKVRAIIELKDEYRFALEDIRKIYEQEGTQNEMRHRMLEYLTKIQDQNLNIFCKKEGQELEAVPNNYFTGKLPNQLGVLFAKKRMADEGILNSPFVDKNEHIQEKMLYTEKKLLEKINELEHQLENTKTEKIKVFGRTVECKVYQCRGNVKIYTPKGKKFPEGTFYVGDDGVMHDVVEGHEICGDNFQLTGNPGAVTNKAAVVIGGRGNVNDVFHAATQYVSATQQCISFQNLELLREAFNIKDKMTLPENVVVKVTEPGAGLGLNHYFKVKEITSEGKVVPILPNDPIASATLERILQREELCRIDVSETLSERVIEVGPVPNHRQFKFESYKSEEPPELVLETIGHDLNPFDPCPFGDHLFGRKLTIKTRTPAPKQEECEIHYNGRGEFESIKYVGGLEATLDRANNRLDFTFNGEKVEYARYNALDPKSPANIKVVALAAFARNLEVNLYAKWARIKQECDENDPKIPLQFYARVARERATLDNYKYTLELEIAEDKNQLNDLQNEVKRIENEYQELKAEEVQIEDSLFYAEQSITGVRNELQGLEGERNALLAEYKKCEEELKQLRSPGVVVEEEEEAEEMERGGSWVREKKPSKDAEKNKKEKEEKAKALNESIEDLRKKLIACDANIKKAGQALQEYGDEYQELEEALTETQQQLEETEQRRIELIGRQDELEINFELKKGVFKEFEQLKKELEVIRVEDLTKITETLKSAKEQNALPSLLNLEQKKKDLTEKKDKELREFLHKEKLKEQEQVVLRNQHKQQAAQHFHGQRMANNQVRQSVFAQQMQNAYYNSLSPAEQKIHNDNLAKQQELEEKEMDRMARARAEQEQSVIAENQEREKEIERHEREQMENERQREHELELARIAQENTRIMSTGNELPSIVEQPVEVTQPRKEGGKMGYFIGAPLIFGGMVCGILAFVFPVFVLPLGIAGGVGGIIGFIAVIFQYNSNNELESVSTRIIPAYAKGEAKEKSKTLEVVPVKSPAEALPKVRPPKELLKTEQKGAVNRLEKPKRLPEKSEIDVKVVQKSVPEKTKEAIKSSSNKIKRTEGDLLLKGSTKTKQTSQKLYSYPPKQITTKVAREISQPLTS